MELTLKQIKELLSILPDGTVLEIIIEEDEDAENEEQ